MQVTVCKINEPAENSKKFIRDNFQALIIIFVAGLGKNINFAPA
jgi:hypothetical protein